MTDEQVQAFIILLTLNLLIMSSILAEMLAKDVENLYGSSIK